MNSAHPKKTTGELGVLLRHWRDVRGKSQFDLSLETGISQKQISFVESGRSVPSRPTLSAIAQALDIPLRDRNPLLLASGYAPSFSDGAWDSAEMKTVTDALRRILRQHEPFPALVMDRYWNVLMTNECAPRFFDCFINMASRKGPRNMLHLMFDPEGMRPFIANWEDVAKGPSNVQVPLGIARRKCRAFRYPLSASGTFLTWPIYRLMSAFEWKGDFATIRISDRLLLAQSGRSQDRLPTGIGLAPGAGLVSTTSIDIGHFVGRIL